MAFPIPSFKIRPAFAAASRATTATGVASALLLVIVHTVGND